MKSMTTAPSQHRISGYQAKVVASTTAGFGLENMDVMFLSFALSSIISQLHLSSMQAGSIATVTNIGMLLGGVFFGVLADRIGRIKVFTYTIFIFALATAAMSVANNLWTIYLCRFIAGIGAGGEYGIGMTVLAESFPKKQLGKVSSYVGIAGQIGAIGASLLATLILPMYGWHVLFLFGLFPVVITFFIRKHLVESATFKKEKEQRGQIRALFQTKSLAYQTIALMIMAIVQIAGYFGLMNWLPTIMQKQLNLSVAGSSSWMLSTIFGMSIGMLTFGWILDKIGPRVAFGIFLVASALGVFWLTLPRDMMSLLLVGTLVGYFSNGMFAGYGAVVSRLYPTEVRATANNVIMNVGRCIGGFSSLIIGWILDNYSVTIVMFFISALYILSFIVMLTVKNLKAANYFGD